MNAIVKLYSTKENEIKKFLEHYYSKNFDLKNNLIWRKDFDNPIEIAAFAGTFIDNCDKYQINLWVCLDKDIYINITKSNINQFIKYLYERYPY